MSLIPPLYCAICAAPCLLPRTEVSPPSPPHTLTESLNPLQDTSSLRQTDCQSIDAINNPSSNSSGNWENEWQVLRVTTGLLTQFSISPSSSTLSPILTSSHTTNSPSDLSTNKKKTERCVAIHSYCLERILKLIRRSIFNSGFSHEENMMLGWSIPKWTGYGPWVRTDGEEVGWMRGVEQGRYAVYWMGSVSQRERWNKEVEGSHLLPSDHISPNSISRPKPSSPLAIERKPQTSALLSLPSHILSQIALDILEIPESSSPDLPMSKTKLIPEQSISNLLAFLRTSFDLSQTHIPSSVWRMLTSHQLHRFKLALMARWRANPSGVGSASQLWISLDEEFVSPVELLLSDTMGSQDDDDDSDEEEGEEGENHVRLAARDVFYWWMYDQSWRSRRRVWHCVVHACATARDADWWDGGSCDDGYWS